LTDEVIVELRSKYYCLVTIDGFVYALNGVAKNKYKLEFPHEAGVAELGKSVGDFIKIAQNLSY
jgi:hypothetical protein